MTSSIRPWVNGIVLIVLLLAARILPAAPAAPVAGLDLQDGDTMVFLGDSITHQCFYTQYLEDFFYTRYPERRIRFHNAGVSGDKAADALARFEADVAPYRPRYVTVLLGMNDGQYEDYQAATFATYVQGMTRTLERIKEIGAQAVVLSPTMFDYTVVLARRDDASYPFRQRSFSPQYNALMAYYGAWALEESMARGLPYVNLWGALNDCVAQERGARPKFTLIPDAIHPGPAGHVIMASAILEQMRPERRAVSAILVNRIGDQWRTAPRQPLAQLAGGPDQVSFTYTAPALPWVVAPQPEAILAKWSCPQDADWGFAFAKAGHRLSNESLRVVGLAPGNYEIRIDGRPIGKPVPHTVLAAKLELQTTTTTPQYQQALQVAVLNAERNEKAIRPLRDLWSKIKGARRKAAGDAAQFETFMQTLRPELQRLTQLAREYEERIHAAAQPQPRHYEIVRVAPPPPAQPAAKKKRARDA